ncbi:MAG TPA: YfiR family protein [Rhizobacter sp.]|nr:YfiR family protein [Rhizobacter sp.]
MTAKSADAPGLDELKAAYLYKFTSFVDWPNAAFETGDSPIVIGIVGNARVRDHLTSLLSGRLAQGRPVVVKQFGAGDAIAEVNVLFVAGSLSLRKDWERRLDGRPVLWVTDVPGGLARGSLINFVQVNHRLRFEASLPAIERSGLGVSSRLLALAETVLTKP